jgi:hypothetical protein
MRTTSRLFRTVVVAAGLMAVSATAAQAMPLGPANVTDRDPLGFTAAHHQLPVVSHSSGGPVVLHRSGFVLGHQLQTAPPVIAQPVAAQSVAAQSVDNGFDWADAAIGALVASVVLILAAVAATIVRPRQTVQL